MTDRIKEKILTEVKVVKGEFSRLFDNLLLAYARSSAVGLERVLGFWQLACNWMIEEDKKAIGICRKSAEREEAYRIALAKLSTKIISPNFEFDRGASIFLRKIYRDACRDARKYHGRDKRNLERGRMLFGQDLSSSAATTLHPPTEMLEDDLRLLEKHHPRCYELFVQVYRVGMKYDELEERFGKSAASLMQERYRCREKLMNTFNNLTK